MKFGRKKRRANASRKFRIASAIGLLTFGFDTSFAQNAFSPTHEGFSDRSFPSTFPAEEFRLTVGSGRILTIPPNATIQLVADPSVTDVAVISSTKIYLFGKKTGKTTFMGLSSSGEVIRRITVVVAQDRAGVSDVLQREAPGKTLSYQNIPGGALLGGQLPTPAAAAHLEDAVQGTLGPGEHVLDQMTLSGSTQVNLRVRVAEVSRSVANQMGFNWNTVFHNLGSFALGVATGGASTAASSAATSVANTITGTVNSAHADGTLTLDAMADEGLVTMLAEPNLTTLSGESASFEAGGEYPIPVPQGLGTVGVEYKHYGVSVQFTPTVLSSGLINMKVTPEVSELSNAGAYAMPGTSTVVPALITRRADTKIELASGQSFAIGGLIQNNTQNNVRKIAWLGDLPVLGALFRSTQFQRNQTELVIVVTAYVVHPTNHPPAVPTDFIRPASDVEQLFLNRLAVARPARPQPLAVPQLSGAAGYIFP